MPFWNVNVMRCQMKFTSALTAGCGAKCRTLRLELSHSSWSSTTNGARHHKVHLKFVAQIYMEQVDNARHAHIEQPELARSWKTTALKDLPGYFTIFHQCMFGSCCLNPVGSWELVKKATALLTSKVTMSVAMNRLCDGQHNHCALEGSASGIGRRTSYMENYQPSLAATLASAIYAPDPPQLWEHAMAVPEQKEVTGRLIQLQTNLKAEAVRTVQRLHRNLGHPSPESLVELLQSRGASDAVVEAARSYKCVACLRYKKPNNPSPATLRQRATELGECVQADVSLAEDWRQQVSNFVCGRHRHQIPSGISPEVRAWSRPDQGPRAMLDQALRHPHQTGDGRRERMVWH